MNVLRGRWPAGFLDILDRPRDAGRERGPRSQVTLRRRANLITGSGGNTSVSRREPCPVTVVP